MEKGEPQTELGTEPEVPMMDESLPKEETLNSSLHTGKDSLSNDDAGGVDRSLEKLEPVNTVGNNNSDVEDIMQSKGILQTVGVDSSDNNDFEGRMHQKGILHNVVQPSGTNPHIAQVAAAAAAGGNDGIQPVPVAAPRNPVHPGAFPVRGVDARNTDRSDTFGVNNDVDNQGLTSESVALTVHTERPDENLTSGLAVAAPVVEPAELPLAQEITSDPNKPPSPSQKRNVPLGIMLMIAGVILIVGIPLIVIAVTSSSDDANSQSDGTMAPSTLSPTAVPSAAPSLSPEGLLLSYLPDYTSVEEMSETSAQAFQWVLDDPNLDEYLLEEWRAVQRFALASLYYATNGDKWISNDHWLSYNVSECEWFANQDWGIEANEKRQLAFLNAIYDFPDGPCGNDNSTEYHYLMLGFSRLQGSLPQDLYLLTNLRWIYILGNQLTGTISTSIGTLTHLEAFGVPANGFSGTLPTELGLLTSMNGFFIFQNKFSGTIPTELALATSLNGAILDFNQLNGHIPSELGTLPALLLLHAHSNQLSGMVPTTIGQLRNSLMSLEVYENKLEGNIPSELGRLKRLTSLRLQDNLLTSTIPSELFLQTKSMQSFRVSQNQLVGSLPTEIGLWEDLSNLWLDHNGLTGELPSEIGLLQNDFIRLSISENNFSGSFPPEIFNLTQAKLRMLEIDGNPFLSGTVPWEVCGIETRILFTCPSMICGCDCPCPDDDGNGNGSLNNVTDESTIPPAYVCTNETASVMRCMGVEEDT
ncbi:Leucine Rich Repeat [Seminavis robusta]|uniref:Leucine Rich Repeat n=1 Tax=Seminavis robusta TaxID=568900 RepID=A0A9N8HB15_9STRA|nr:Leucine Rich Repeat [Seminavis robusta]|eukprot:Sro343_g122030.1 Leucine Rich Repeat (757) ;mRNA; f:47957-50227